MLIKKREKCKGNDCFGAHLFIFPYVCKKKITEYPNEII